MNKSTVRRETLLVSGESATMNSLSLVGKRLVVPVGRRRLYSSGPVRAQGIGR